MYVSLILLSSLSHNLENLSVMNVVNFIAAVHEIKRNQGVQMRVNISAEISLMYSSSSSFPCFIIITLSCKIPSWWPLFFLATRAPAASSLADFVYSFDLRLVSEVGRLPSASLSLRYSRLPRPCAAACYTCNWFRSRHSKWPCTITPAKM